MYVVSIIILLIGSILGFCIARFFAKKELSAVEKRTEILLEERQKYFDTEKQNISLEYKEDWYRKKMDLEQSFDEEKKLLQETSKKLSETSERLSMRQEELLEQERKLVLQEKDVVMREHDVCYLRSQLEKKIDTITKQLEDIANFTKEQAKELLLQEVKEQSSSEMAKMIRSIETDAKEHAKKKAQEIISSAIQRYATEYVASTTTTAITLPSEDMKGRIIGREGRNIRAIESATGVDLIIDDTPEVITISSFSPIRRQIAGMAIQYLIQDGRIHPAKIEEIVQKCELEVEEQIKEAGERAIFDAGIHGVTPEIVRVLGSLKFRTSYSQNVLQHSLEVSFIAGMIASELGMNVKIAKRAGLLHDIGKAVDHEMEGPHALIGGELAKKYGEEPQVVEAIMAHHGDIPILSPLSFIIQAADSISGSRPGARREILENYVKRLEELELIAMEKSGVVKAFAIQAGREIRVIVDADEVDDDKALLLSKEIAKTIEERLTYPGQVKVLVIREKRVVAIAK